MGKYGLSATEIGLRIGATATEVNRLLKEQGFTYGEPGAYGLTPKGLEFGVQLHHDNGYGGSAYRSWETTHFEPGITKVLDHSAETLAKARADIAAHKEVLKAARQVARAGADAEFAASQAKLAVSDAPSEIDPKKVLWVVAGAIVVVGTTFGVYKGVRWYKGKKAAKAAAEDHDVEASSDPSSTDD